MKALLNKKVLLQYSGGKDSTACLIKLKNEGIVFEAIHFRHSFSYNTPTNEVIKHCKTFGIKVNIVDIDYNIKEVFLKGYNQRPCRQCKAIMDKITLEFAVKNQFDVICVGDTKSDATLVNRLPLKERSNSSLSKYFNADIILPENIFIWRPLIEMNEGEVFKTLEVNNIKIQRVHDTGDKYFEYSREGCPLQFKDFGVNFSFELMKKLKKYNDVCSSFAKENGIRASIHLPSEFIVTIPQGFEDNCRKYLMSHGCYLKTVSYLNNNYIYNFTIAIYMPLSEIELLGVAFIRFLERLGIKGEIINSFNAEILVGNPCTNVSVSYDRINNIIFGRMISSKKISKKIIRNLLLEIFHTDKIEVCSNITHGVIHSDSLLKATQNTRFLLEGKVGRNFIRSDSLEQIGETDLKRLKQLKVTNVIGLKNIEYPQLEKKLNDYGIELKKICFYGDTPRIEERNFTDEYVINTYFKLIEQYDVINELFNELGNTRGSTLFFCKYGRDRAGLISALIALVSGATYDEIVRDYLISECFLANNWLYKKAISNGNLQPLKRTIIEGFLDSFFERYSCIDNYFATVGISKKTIDKIKQKLGGEIIYV